MIYLDNSATTHKKPRAVIKAVNNALKNYSVNAGRGGYKLSIDAGLRVLQFRLNASCFFGLDNPENVIITKSCTEALNLALFATAKKDGHIIISTFEHNSVARAVTHLKSTHNIGFSVVYPKENGIIEINDIEKEIQENTYLIVINHTSNVTGATQNITKIGNLCKNKKLKFLVDCAQSAGHEVINMNKQNINMLAVAGHKGLYGPQGIGLLLIQNVKLNQPLLYGGTGSHSEKISQPDDIPDGYESGTQNLPSIFGLNAGIDYVKKNFDKINNKIAYLTKYLIDNIKNLNGINLYSHSEKNGVLAFSITDKDNNEVANILDSKYKICLRNGLHCAPLAHSYLGTIEHGLLRVGISSFNKKREINKLIKALKYILSGD